MNDVNKQFEERLRQDLNSLADRVSIDNLESKVAQKLQRRTIYRLLTVGGIAAALLIFGYLVMILSPSSPIQQTSFAAIDVDKTITNAGISTELFLAAQMLAQAPGGEEISQENFQYIIVKYPETKAARQAHEQIQKFYNRRNIQ
jgi:hypothetical protein